jgi:outer membrane protein TolC
MQTIFSFPQTPRRIRSRNSLARAAERLSFGWVVGALVLAASLALAPISRAQDGGRSQGTASDSTSILRAYVHRALASNHALEQEQIDLARSFAALRKARGAFLPTVDLEARYSRAEGGRTIDFPAGDLLNPVYSTLNDLTGEQRFPQTENVSVPLLREEEQRTALRLEQPIFVPKILHNYRANKDRAAAQKAAVTALRRQVIRDVKVAYFNYLKAQRGVDVLRATETLTEENLRTNRRLLQRAKVTKDVVLRAEADVADVRQQRIEAEKDRTLARSYLNFLLNRPLDTPIQTPDGFEQLPMSPAPPSAGVTATIAGTTGVAVWRRLQAAATRDLHRLQAQAVAARPELERLSRSIEAAEHGVRAAQADYWPEVVLSVEGGLQGERYSVTGDSPFVLGAVVLRWTLFDGFRDEAEVERARLRQRRLESRWAQVREQIRMEVERAQEKVRVARTSLTAAGDRARAARESFRITRRRHEEGMANQVTLVDARTTLTDAALNLSATRYEYLKRLAELEYAIGTAGPYAATAEAPSSARFPAPRTTPLGASDDLR